MSMMTSFVKKFENLMKPIVGPGVWFLVWLNLASDDDSWEKIKVGMSGKIKER